MSKTNIVEKIQKLLALADENGGGTEAERLNAAEKAQTLLLQHNLDIIEIEAQSDIGPEFDQDTIEFDKMADHWKGTLSNVIGDTVNVHVHYRPGRKKSHRTFILVGRKDSIQYVRSLTEHLAPYFETACETAFIKAKDDGELTRCSRCRGLGYDGWDSCGSCKGSGRKPVNKRVFRNSFYSAAVSRTKTRLIERKRSYENSLPTTGTDLIRNDKLALDLHLKEEFGKFQKTYSRTTGSRAGAAAGASAGNSADLSGSSKLGNATGLLGA